VAFVAFILTHDKNKHGCVTVDDSTMTRPLLLYLHHYTIGADDADAAAAAADDYSVHIKTASAHDEDDDDDVSPSAVQGNYMSLLSSLNLVNTKQALQLDTMPNHIISS
jgi:hypothetical protein